MVFKNIMYMVPEYKLMILFHFAIAAIFRPLLPPPPSPASAPFNSLPGGIRDERTEQEPKIFPH